MKVNKCYNFRLEPNNEQIQLLNQAIGCARFVFNNVLATSLEMFHRNEFIRYVKIIAYPTIRVIQIQKGAAITKSRMLNANDEVPVRS